MTHAKGLAECGQGRAWTGLYRRDYDLATAESRSHPAKASWGLAFRILDHLRELGLLHDDDCVLDPMCGTSRFPIAACAQGLRAVAVELEPKFVAFSEQNKEYASRKLGRPLDLTIIQGDSRYLSSLLNERGLVTLVSPPYTSGGHHNDIMQAGGGEAQGAKPQYREGYGQTPGQIGRVK